jgi:hypothetical protein
MRSKPCSDRDCTTNTCFAPPDQASQPFAYIGSVLCTGLEVGDRKQILELAEFYQAPL